jgi:hypothetical protein
MSFLLPIVFGDLVDDGFGLSGIVLTIQLKSIIGRAGFSTIVFIPVPLKNAHMPLIHYFRVASPTLAALSRANHLPARSATALASVGDAFKDSGRCS